MLVRGAAFPPKSCMSFVSPMMMLGMRPFVNCNGEVLVPCSGQIMPVNSLTRWRAWEGNLSSGVRMNIDDSSLIAQFQRLITEMLVEKRLGQRRSELTDEIYQTWRKVEQRGLKKTPEYRNVLSRADQHALWLAGLVKLSSPDVAPPLSLKERELTAISQEAAE
jgi:hypothetical protein